MGDPLFKDISAHKRDGEEYKTILRTAMNGFWLVDANGYILDVNEAYCNMTGYSREELLKLRIQDIEAVETPEETAQHLKLLFEVGWDRFETRHRCKDGRILGVEVSANHMPFEGGRVVAFLRDVTEQKRLEREIAEIASQERRRLGHELHDGLGQILTGAALACKALEGRLEEKHFSEYKDIRKIKDLLNEAIKRVKDISRGLSLLEIENIGIEGALSQFARNTEDIYNIKCAVDSFVEVPTGDKIIDEQLYLIACEAVTNAIKHGKAQKVLITLHLSNVISLSVKDDGIGFIDGVNYNKGMGLRIMKYRAGIIGASLDISSGMGGETAVTCVVRR